MKSILTAILHEAETHQWPSQRLNYVVDFKRTERRNGGFHSIEIHNTNNAFHTYCSCFRGNLSLLFP